MSQIAALLAFDARMVAFAAGAVHAAHKADLQLLGQGQVYEPKSGRPYYASHMPAYTSEPLGFGVDAIRRERGIYRLMINRPAAEGARVSGVLAAALVAYFGRATNIPAIASAVAQAPIIIENASEAPPVLASGWLSTAVSVVWFTGA